VRQIFRIYRDVRFSSDPTPYKVKLTKQAGPTAPFGPACKHQSANARM